MIFPNREKIKIFTKSAIHYSLLGEQTHSLTNFEVANVDLCVSMFLHCKFVSLQINFLPTNCWVSGGSMFIALSHLNPHVTYLTKYVRILTTSYSHNKLVVISQRSDSMVTPPKTSPQDNHVRSHGEWPK